ncbi:ADP-ribosylglycohydrolase family protein [Alteromonas sp. S167]|uniref:ADP-ribosylglycohydrolase family protein n=1 Tax=Alteromonas sp. S167 TaxID=3117402 RepID=UPI002FE2FB03
MNTLFFTRATAALKNAFIGDALAMPVHWYYNPADILKAFPLGVEQFEDAPEFHPSSIMSLHSTQQGGRSNLASASQKEIVGDVILKGKREYWGGSNRHYHHGMKAGENTLNAYCARVLLDTIASGYSADAFLNNYIAMMCADPVQHPDTYAESYHRGFFANLELGKPPKECGAVTHDTASIGGLVSVTPLAVTLACTDTSLLEIQSTCRTHLMLTHPSDELAKVCDAFVELIYRLLRRDSESPTTILEDIAQRSASLSLEKLVAKKKSDIEVVGRLYSPACYISDAWPSVLYFAYRYRDNAKRALTANTNVGGDNVHRGFVLGAIMGLISEQPITSLYSKLLHKTQIEKQIQQVLEAQ